MINELTYEPLIKRIKRRRRWVLALLVVAVLALMLFGTPFSLVLFGETQIAGAGLHPIAVLLLFLLCMVVGTFAYAIASLPIYTAMDVECDPEKQLILNAALSKQTNIQTVMLYANDYFYLGRYPEAIGYAQKMAEHRNERIALTGYLQLARCYYFLGDSASLHQASAEFGRRLSGAVKMKPKPMAVHRSMEEVLCLLCALADHDAEAIGRIGAAVKPWNALKQTECFVHYLKGLCALRIDDRDEAVFRFKTVREIAPKTVFAALSENALASLG